MPTSSCMRSCLNLSLRLVRAVASFSSSSLLSISSGLLAIVATDDAVFLRGDATGGGVLGSLLEELRDSQENGLVSFRVGGGGFAGGCGGGAEIEAAGLLTGGSVAGGDQGTLGKALAMLPMDNVLLGCPFCVEFLRAAFASGCGAASSSRLTLSRSEVREMRLEAGEGLRSTSCLTISLSLSGSPS
jgi:hypothetical protein